MKRNIFIKILTVALTSVLTVACCFVVGCKPNAPDLPPLDDTSFGGYTFDQVTASNIPVTYTPLNMATEYMQQQDIYGDGCQWPVSFDCSADGSLMLYGIDVAGMYRSLDHGITWQKCNTGIVNRGVGMFGIDPRNPMHVLAVGLSGSSAKNTGVYISYDGCETWQSTGFNVKIRGERYLWDGLEFDPTSYSASDNLCKVAYYSIPYMRDCSRRNNAYAPTTLESPLKQGEAGLYKTVDGGKTFSQISFDEKLADGIVKICDNGNLLLGNQHGLFRLDSNGKVINSWLINNFDNYQTDKITITLQNGVSADILKCYLGITGLDCVGNTIFAQTWDGIYTLNLDGVDPEVACSASPQMIQSENYKSQNWPQFLAVSKSNPQHMVYQYRSRVDKVSWDTYWVNYVDVSFDGGKTWTKANADQQTVFTAGNWAGREKLFIIDPSDDSNVLCFGSDTVMRSSDGGINFVQASGISNMMCGGKMHFNFFDPDIIFSGAQDYGGTVSLDGGKTFRRVTVSGTELNFGHMYDAFAADAYTYFGVARTSWYGENHLVVTHDGGKSWVDTGITTEYGTPSISQQSHKNPDVLFSGAYRSTDRGYTWKEMKGCICVVTVSYGEGMELIGYDKDRNIVFSDDDGKTWTVVFDRVTNKFNNSPRTVSESIRDLAFDHVNNIVYAAVDSHHASADGTEYNSHAFYKIVLDQNKNFVERKALPIHADTDGYENYSDIEVDPNATNVVYVALAGNYFSNKFALQRSVDGGETWQVLTSNTESATDKKGLCTNNGGYEASMLAVDPVTGRLFIGCGCYGFEWVTPPYDSSQLKHVAPQEHTVAFVCDGKVVHSEKVKNNRTVSYLYDEDGLTFKGWYTDSNLRNKWQEGTLIYNSLYLFAKMEKAQQITFYCNSEVFAKQDLEDYNTNFEIPRPAIDGYCFAGWFTDEKLSHLADLDNVKKSIDVYAGFYKTSGNVFDASQLDFGAYIQYSNQKLSSTERVSDDEQCDNRCAYIQLETNCYYLVTFKMDVRCRYGLNKNDFVKNKAPDVYYIYQEDTNGSKPIDKWVQLVFDSGDCTQMLLFYYTSTSESGLDYLQIRQTISVFKLENNNLVYRIEK